MASYSIWENILLAGLILLMLWWLSGGIKPAIEKSKTAKPNWPELIVPLGLVIAWVIFLIAMV